MIKFTTKSGVKLRTLFETISPLLTEGNIEFSKDDIRVRSSNEISSCDARIKCDEDDILEYTPHPTRIPRYTPR